MSKQEIFDLKERIKPQILQESQPNYTYYQVKLSECTITAYTSGKVVFQGKDVSWLEEDSSKKESQPSLVLPQAGSDEVGTGDYFGPVIVSACIVTPDAYEKIKHLGIQDSKQINDDQIRKLGPILQEHCPYSSLILSNAKYNTVHATNNMVAIKCKMHNQAYVNLVHKGYTLPDFMMVDQFVQKSSYYKYLKDQPEVITTLQFETKAENKYISVACASIIARYTFLQCWDAMEEKYNFTFDKGAGKNVDQCAQRFVDQYGIEALGDVAKIHFANTKKIKA